MSIEHTPTSLVIRYTPWLESLVGVLFLGGGLWPFMAGERIFGTGFMIAGAVLILVFANIVTSTFDRAAGRFSRSTKGVIRHSDVTYPLDEIVGVQVQATSSGSSPSKSYRVMLVLRSRERVAVSSGYSSGKADKERVAAEIRRFLNLPEAPEVEPFGLRDMVKLMKGE